MRTGRRLALLAAILLILAAAAPPPAPRPLLRDVLALYNSADGASAIDNNIRMNAEMPLNHLGLRVSYHDVAAGLPGPSEMARYRGVVTWFESNRMADAAGYWLWLAENLRAGRRVAILGELGPRLEARTGGLVPLATVNATLNLLGLAAGENHTDFPLDIELLRAETGMVEFERRLAGEIMTFDELVSTAPGNRVCLSLRMKSTGARDDAVVLTPRGGVAIGYAHYYDPDIDRRQWRIDPFRFFTAAFGVEQSPRPDVTTLNGNRLFYSHVDGDGFLSVSRLDRRSLCGEVLLDAVFRRYAALPITVSVIGAEVDPEVAGTERSIACARRIFALPNIEPASHTFSHPLIWDRRILSRLTPLTEYTLDIDTRSLARHGAVLAFRIPGYTFSPERETVEAVARLARLLPAGRAGRLLLWSGNCLPNERTIAVCDEAGIRNLNGGDPVFDEAHPSYCHLAPLARRVGRHIQVLTSASNENLYTNLWTGPFGGFRNVIRTFERTESPRRVGPVNVYYHHYSAEMAPASLDALRHVYDWVAARRFFAVHASRYADMVNGFYDCEMSELGPHAWRITRNGACRTIRFDGEARYPRLSACRGVLGFEFHQGSLYIFLDESAEHVVVLEESPPDEPHLAQATADVLALQRTADGGCRFRSHSLAAAEYTWRNLAPNTLHEATVRTSTRVERRTVTSDARGTCRFWLPLFGAAAIEIAPVRSP